MLKRISLLIIFWTIALIQSSMLGLGNLSFSNLVYMFLGCIIIFIDDTPFVLLLITGVIVDIILVRPLGFTSFILIWTSTVANLLAPLISKGSLIYKIPMAFLIYTIAIVTSKLLYFLFSNNSGINWEYIVEDYIRSLIIFPFVLLFAIIVRPFYTDREV